MHHTSLVLKGEYGWHSAQQTDAGPPSFSVCITCSKAHACWVYNACRISAVFLRDSNRDTAFADNSFVNSVFYGEP
uniref:Uncharacterized protein n=1 Tax=Anguilla anguilla TaxID=7936 RepID=A0A0E9PW33_ANGAN